jgi:hypothetical protein
VIPPLQEEDFKEWLRQPITQLVMQWHQRLIDDGKEAWASRDFVRGKIEETALVNAEAVGKVQGLGMFLGLSAEGGFAAMMQDLHEKP